MNAQERINSISTTFNEASIFEASLRLFKEAGASSLNRNEANLSYLIYSELEDAIFDARSAAPSAERALFLELLELMAWAMYKSWRPLAEHAISCGESEIDEASLNHEKIINEFRANLDCEEGARLRKYLIR